MRLYEYINHCLGLHFKRNNMAAFGVFLSGLEDKECSFQLILMESTNSATRHCRRTKAPIHTYLFAYITWSDTRCTFLSSGMHMLNNEQYYNQKKKTAI